MSKSKPPKKARLPKRLTKIVDAKYACILQNHHSMAYNKLTASFSNMLNMNVAATPMIYLHTLESSLFLE
jgi:hypothetical protein